jgi:uncharacterized cupredoxin-like copper-binding protein
VHEFNIGTSDMHKAHQKKMKMMAEYGAIEAERINHNLMKMKMPDGSMMEHNDPNSAFLEPEKSQKTI